MNYTAKKRVESIDVLRGIVMVIMALDHTREYFHSEAFSGDPLNVLTTTVPLFFTRWITHYCAPIFVFLSGVSIYLQSLRKTQKELSIFLLKRGVWLIFVELALITFALSFNPLYSVFFLQVIWVIGISMVLMALLIYLPFNVLLGLGLVIVLGHDLLDFPETAKGFKPGFWWSLLHRSNGYPFLGHFLLILYPFLPWTGLMLLGYCTGKIFTTDFSYAQRRKTFLWLGSGLIVFFIALRLTNVYGDPIDWAPQKEGWRSILSFLNANKYPPSLLYLSMTIGPAFLALALLEPLKNRFTNIMMIYGRTAFFYYIIHFYLIHLTSALCFFGRGHSLQEAISYATKNEFPFLFIITGEGFNLEVVYLIWITIVAFLYLFCKWYDGYKIGHPEKWWLSYL
jgi:uncharacterized membrane protein